MKERQAIHDKFLIRADDIAIATRSDTGQLSIIMEKRILGFPVRILFALSSSDAKEIGAKMIALAEE